MIITYQSDLDDVCAPAIRQFLRSGTSRKQKIWSTVRGAIWCGVAGMVLCYAYGGYSPIAAAVGIATGLLVGGSLNYFTYIPSVTGRIRKHVERETQGKLPSTTSFRVKDGRLVCDHLDVTTSYPLSGLERLEEIDGRLEICLGNTGLCTIPLRAFADTGEKAAFIAEIRKAAETARTQY